MVSRTRKLNTKAPSAEGGRASEAGLVSYLANLGLDNANLAAAISLLAGGPGAGQQVEPATGANQFTIPEQAPPSAPAPKKTIGLYLAEEQPILKQAYQLFLTAESGIEVLASSDDASIESVERAVSALEPDVVVLGVKKLQPSIVEGLQNLRTSHLGTGLVLLFAFYDTRGIKALGEVIAADGAGSAYLPKHTVDTAQQLVETIHAVAEGRIIVDPLVMDGLIKTDDPRNSVLSDLSPRELEVLGWISKATATTP